MEMTAPPKISVIIPIFGVERYIRNCAESLLSQSIATDVEFIFVNDCTKDNSISLLEDIINCYPSLRDNIRIVNHSENKGLPAARNTGLSYATGEYIVHVDGDDICEKNMLELFMQSAKENNSDFVWSDYYITFGENKRIIRQPSLDSPEDVVRGMLRGTMKYNVWNKMVRRKLYVDNGIKFPEGYSMGEDMTMILIALHSSRCSYIAKPLYNYIQRDSQMTAEYTDAKLAELKHNCELVSTYITTNFIDRQFETEYPAFYLLMKWPFLLDGKLSSFRRWKSWFPESNQHIMGSRGVNLRIKIVEWFASKGLFSLVWLHYILVIKIYYGIVYGANNKIGGGRRI